MVVLPAGEFMMGSPASETGHQDVEGLPRRVVIPKRIAIGKFEVTVDQFSLFIAETGMTSAGNRCRALVEVDGTVPLGASGGAVSPAWVRGNGVTTGGLRQLARRAGVRGLAPAPHWQAIPAADRSRMGICRTGRYENQV